MPGFKSGVFSDSSASCPPPECGAVLGGDAHQLADDQRRQGLGVIRHDIQAPRGAGPVKQPIHRLLDHGPGGVEPVWGESVLDQSPQAQVLGAFLVDHHPSLDALEVLHDASVLRPELAVNEEPGPVALKAGVAERLNNVVVPGDEPGPQRSGVVDGILSAHAVQERVELGPDVRARQLQAEIDGRSRRRLVGLRDHG